MKRINQLFGISLITLGLSACGGGGSSSSNDEPESRDVSGLSECDTINSTQAVVCGTALASDGVTPLINAEVTLLDDGAKPSGASARGVEDPDVCLTDVAGDYVCLLPEGVSGAVSLLISLSGFVDATVDTTVSPGSVTEAGSQPLESDNSNKWVVVPGAFDGVQVLLSQLKDCTLSDGSGNPFNYATGSPESARGSADCENKGLLVLDDEINSAEEASAFFSSNDLFNYDSLFINCSADYGNVSGVNSVVQDFVDDGGHVYFSDLSSSWLSSAFPGKINFAGNSTSTGTIEADVTTPGLQSVVGSSMEIEFDLSVWSAIDTVEPDVTTFVEGDITSLSSTYSGIHPITVGWRENNSSGCVFYSSYHIEGASQGSEQERAMKYLVQNIDSVCQ
ncbi:hypothetical protein OO007_11465 [Cocleimonas sp. KMM 6892]|uniref:hypothetical protein n=1 Tax=unclassified Cocleimonas TaxID=2639732 RepID=UPI002DB9F26A|nr:MULTISPECIES: hypothetical protein [unclassified Cocleimonas]MEB8432849.1 hypothetical protein [Cocleimonas sp. KMM 6892]MEC4715708.1 hypothetical protein [Cocleimonas sp. KMM 6895]MEC4744674.1 hypothetical protein [Cocleimonas sp. KMM 6896]